MTFDEALKLNHLGDRIEERYGRWGHFTQANADVVSVASLTEGSTWKISPVTLMAMTAFTWMNESTWSLNPTPNTNGKLQSPWHWDVGPFQLNVQWAHRMAWQQDFKTRDLNWKEVFGITFYGEDGTPTPFNGDVVTHTRCAVRRLLYDQREP